MYRSRGDFVITGFWYFLKTGSSKEFVPNSADGILPSKSIKKCQFLGVLGNSNAICGSRVVHREG